MRRTTEVVERRAVAAVEDVAFHARAVFARDGHVAAIVEGFLQRVAQLGLGRQLGNPAFDLVRASRAIDDFKMVNGEIVLRFAHDFAFRLSLFANKAIHH